MSIDIVIFIGINQFLSFYSVNAFWFHNSESSLVNPHYPILVNNINQPNETISRETYKKLQYISNNINASNINESVVDGLKGQDLTGDLNSVIDIVFKYLQKNNTQNNGISEGTGPGAGGTQGIPFQMSPVEAERNSAIAKNIIAAISQTYSEYKQDGGEGGTDGQQHVVGGNKVVHYMVKVLTRILAAFDASPQAQRVEAELRARLRRDYYDALIGDIKVWEAGQQSRRAVALDGLTSAQSLPPKPQNSEVTMHKKPNPKQVWGYAILFVTIICFCALTGALFLSFMKKKYYKMMLQFMMGLAVGSLSGSAVFHLIPQAFNLLENDVHHSYIKKSGTVIGGIYLFLVTEWLIKLFLEKRRAAKLAQEEERLALKAGQDYAEEKGKRRTFVRFLLPTCCLGSCCGTGSGPKNAYEPNSKVSALPNGSARCGNNVSNHQQHKALPQGAGINGNAVVTNFTQLSALEMEKEMVRDSNDRPELAAHTLAPQPEDDLNDTLDSNGEDNQFCQLSSGLNDTNKRARAHSCSSVLKRKVSQDSTAHSRAAGKRHVSMQPMAYDLDDDNALAITITPDEMIKTCSHEEGLHFAGQNTVVTLAYMILLGDGLHNFIDGLSIGAAFSQSILSGVSISLAVIFEEFPHELGDFAILINSGMTVKKAMLCNFVSASTCYIGMFFGILLGENEEVSYYIFALAAGMFLYISLVDMMPELNKSIEKANKTGSLASTLVIQYTGVAIGLTSMCVLAKYASNITF